MEFSELKPEEGVHIEVRAIANGYLLKSKKRDAASYTHAESAEEYHPDFASVERVLVARLRDATMLAMKERDF